MKQFLKLGIVGKSNTLIPYIVYRTIYPFIVMTLLDVFINTYSLQLPLLNADTYRVFYACFWQKGGL